MTTTTDDRSRWHKLTDAVLGTLEDLRPITTRTARKRGNRAFHVGIEVGIREAEELLQRRLTERQDERLESAR